MALVAYSDSEDEGPVSKKRRVGASASASANANEKDEKYQDDDDEDGGAAPPPLPASFLDLYSSTVRVSNTDDPFLHAGRRRVVKHVQGNWAAHVYLEWLPSPTEYETLNHLLQTLPNPDSVHSLLQTPLAVPLPLHISLSAPLVLRTETKDKFLSDLTGNLTPILRSLRHPIAVHPASLSWHGNENSSRYFLVLRVEDTPEDHHGNALTLLNQLLRASNRVAKEYGQPQLYTSASRRNTTSKSTQEGEDTQDFSSYFHISVGWTLPSPDLDLQDENLKTKPLVEKVMESVRDMKIPFDAVKIRLGQDVTALPFGAKRSQRSSGRVV